MVKEIQHEQAARTRANILNSAELLFAEKGYDGTGMMEIAEDAGVPKSLIYYYFRNKNEVLKELLNRLNREMIDLISAEKSGERPENVLTTDGFNRMLHRMYELYDSRKHMYRIIHQEALKTEFVAEYLMEVQLAQQTSIDYFKNAGMAVEEQDLRLAHFFLIIVPFLSFVVFQEEWCVYNGVEQDKARENVFDLLSNVSALILSKSIKKE